LPQARFSSVLHSFFSIESLPSLSLFRFVFFDLISIALDHTDLSFSIWPLTPVCLSNRSIAHSLLFLVFLASLGSAHHSTVPARRLPLDDSTYLVNPWEAQIQTGSRQIRLLCSGSTSRSWVLVAHLACRETLALVSGLRPTQFPLSGLQVSFLAVARFSLGLVSNSRKYKVRGIVVIGPVFSPRSFRCPVDLDSRRSVCRLIAFNRFRITQMIP
jgi:hypothetical protein